MSHRPGCVGQAVVKVQRGKTKGEQSRGDSSGRRERGSNREVVSKEISVRIIVTCGHDTWADGVRRGEGSHVIPNIPMSNVVFMHKLHALFR